MRILRTIFAPFRGSVIGQILGATCVGLAVGLLVFPKLDGENSLVTTGLTGAGIGLLSGCLLTSARMTFGAICLLIAMFTTYPLISNTDKNTPVAGLSSIPVLFFVLGAWLMISGWRRLRVAQSLYDPVDLTD